MYDCFERGAEVQSARLFTNTQGVSFHNLSDIVEGVFSKGGAFLYASNMISEFSKIFTPDNLELAFQWLCKQRKHFPPNADIWYLRFHWKEQKQALLAQLNSDEFYFQPLQRITKANGEAIHLWTSIDSLVLKVMATELSKVLPCSKRCTHLKGHGGAKQTVNAIYQQLPTHSFVFRTDVKSYYESINHHILLDKLAIFVKDKQVLNLLTQYLRRSVDIGGNFVDIKQGISSGCPLSPLISSFYLVGLDKAMEGKSVFYRRYMDDIIVLAKSRWQLRRAIRCVNHYFTKLALKQHPDKTFIGNTAKGFDFLGYEFSNRGISPSTRTWENFRCRLSRLYEQKKHSPNWQMLLDDYRQRWLSWVTAGLSPALRNVLILNDDVLHLIPTMPTQTLL